jgi:hypothetical protein
MQQNIYYIQFALHFANKSINELVASFNREVGCNGWVAMRAYHDRALLDEFQRRGIDVSAVYDGKSLSFAHPVMYSLTDNKLATIC